MEEKQNDKQAKTHEHPYTRMNNHEHPWTPMSTRARMSTHELTWTRVFPNTMQLANYLLNHLSHSFWVLILGCWLCEFLIWLFFFLNWTLFLFFCFIFFCFVLWWLRAPKKSLPIFAKHVFLINIYVYSHLFIYSNIKYIYIYVCVCNVMYLYIQYKYICIYTCVCVCVWGGAAWKWGVLFSSQRTLFGTKKGQTYPCIYNIYIYIFDRCFLKSCVGLSHPKYMFSGFLSYVVFQHHFIGKKCIKPKSGSLEITI